MAGVKEVSSAAAIICYRGDVTDTYTNLTEALVYHLLLRRSWKAKTVETWVGAVFKALNIRPEGLKKYQHAYLRCF
jgi:hypothetical protein